MTGIVSGISNFQIIFTSKILQALSMKNIAAKGSKNVLFSNFFI